MLSWHSLLGVTFVQTYTYGFCVQNIQTQTKHDTEAIYRIVNNQIKITNQFKRDRCVLQYLSIFIYFLGPLFYSFTISW